MVQRPNAKSVRDAISTIAHELGEISEFEIRQFNYNNGDVYLQVETKQPIPGVEEGPTNKYIISSNVIGETEVVTIHPSTNI